MDNTIILKVHDMVLNDRRLKVREIVKAMGISHGSVVSILNDHLSIRKLSSRCMLRLLIIDHNINRVTTSLDGLALFNRNMDEFCAVTVDPAETKQQSKQCISRG